jgi:energy-coupling factor transporter ATP-binding protein EcfA2
MPERPSDLPLRYQLYGLVIAANAPIAGAPPAPASATPDLTVDFDPLPDPSILRHGAEVIRHASLQDAGGVPLFTLFRRGDDYLFDFPDGAQFVIPPGASHIRASWPPGAGADLAGIYLVSTVLAFVLRLRGHEVLHAAAVLVDGRAAVIFGPSGAGKSTLAACLAARGFAILSEDVTALVDHGMRFDVLPSHRRIRLWPDAVALLRGDAHALPLLAGADWKRYLELDDDAAPPATAAFPLAALYSLDDRRDDGPRVIALDPREALLDLVANTDHSVRDPRLSPANFERLGRLVANVPLRLAVPHKDLGSVFQLADAIVADVRSLP